MAQRPDASSSAWLSLGEASQILGITPATLRRWVDRGEVAAFVTPGGHRRFRRNTIEALIPTPRSPRAFAASVGGSATRVASAYRRARHGHPTSHDNSILSDTDRADFRDRGRRLLAMLLEHLDGREPSRLREATGAAGDYGRRAAELGLSLSDTVEAFVRFRRAFTGELAVVARRRRLDTHDATALIVEAERAVDQLLVALTNGHAAGRA